MAVINPISYQNAITDLNDQFSAQSHETSFLTKFVDISDYMTFGQDFRDYYTSDGTQRRETIVRHLLPLGWNFYRQDNLDYLLAKIRKEIDPAADMYSLTDILEFIFNQYQAQIANNPDIDLNEEQIRQRIQEMNCKTTLMYSRKFKLFLANQFEYQQFRRLPQGRLKDGRNLPPVLVERERRRDHTMNLPKGLILRKPPVMVKAEKKKACWEVSHNPAFIARVNRALAEPTHDSYLSARRRPAGTYTRTLPQSFMQRP